MIFNGVAVFFLFKAALPLECLNNVLDVWLPYTEDNVMTILGKRRLKYSDSIINHGKCSVLTIPHGNAVENLACLVLKTPYMSMGRYTGIFVDSQAAN